MNTGRYTEAKVISILRQAEGGVPVAGRCREYGMGNASFYRVRATKGGMEASLISQMRAKDRAIAAIGSRQWPGHDRNP